MRPSVTRSWLTATLMTGFLLFNPAPATTQDSHLVVITGLGGDEEHRERFNDWAITLLDAAERLGMSGDQVTYLAEKTGLARGRADGRSRGDEIRRVFRGLRARAGADDRIFVIFIGHGTGNREESKVSLPGPDLSASDFAEILSGFPTQRVVFVNTGSASGEFVRVLSGPNRAIVTATRSVREANEPMFGGHFVHAFSEDVADMDKNGRTSLLEAFMYARREVARVYEEEDLLLTEHALLDDNGDAEGSQEIGDETLDGAFARALFLGPSPTDHVAAADADDPELARLYGRKAELEGKLAALRAMSDQMEAERYEAELEELLLQVARNGQAIRAREGSTP